MDAASGSIAIGTPGEASRSIAMRVTAYDRPTGNVTISFAPACGATDHTVYAGPLASVSSIAVTERVCNRGVGGATSFTLGPGSYFWLIVGNDGADEGSYGTNGGGVERPEDSGASACNLPQLLATSCDP